MAINTGDPRGPGMPASGGYVPVGIAPEPVVIADNRGEVDLSFDSYVPKGALYVTNEDRILIQANASIGCNVTLQYKILRPDGRVIVSKESLSVPGRSGAILLSRQLTPGLLLSASLVSNTFFTIDEFLFASLGIFQGAASTINREQTLCGGYITNDEGISYPNGGYHEQTEGMGVHVAYNMGTPGAGQELSYTIPSNSMFRPFAFSATLTTSATVANRQVQLICDEGSGSNYFKSPLGVAQAASLVWVYSFAKYPFATLQFNNDQLIFFDNVMKMTATLRIRTVTLGLQAGDQWSLSRLLGEQWSYM
jgi:hypothetical protein